MDTMCWMARLSDAFERAEKLCATTTEPHWKSVVVSPILQLLRRIESFKKTAIPNAKNVVLDVYVQNLVIDEARIFTIVVRFGFFLQSSLDADLHPFHDPLTSKRPVYAGKPPRIP